MLITPNLSLPYIDLNEAQREVTHNDAIRALDALVQLVVLDRDLAAPPGSPADGDRYIVAASPAGEWVGHVDAIAAWQDGAWRFYPPRLGWIVYAADEGALLAYTGSVWVDAIAMLTSLQNMVLLGVGTMADATNPFSAKLNNVLWVARALAEGGNGDLRWKMSKEGAANTLSMLFQTAASGHAEIGLTGDNDFHVKVSPDGAAWLDAVTIDRTTGKLALGQGFADPADARAKLAAAPFDAAAFSGMQVNGRVDISQEFGATGATLASGNAKYTADMWEAAYVHIAGTAVVTSGQVAASSFPVSLPGFSFGHRIQATTAISSPVNGDYALHRQKIEGHRVARLGWGASGAQPIAIAFRFYSTAAGTAFIRLGNSAGNRFYYREFAVATGWNFIAETIPGDTSGTWEQTTSAGLIVEIFSSGKVASPAAPGAWTATGTIQTTNSTNLLGSNNNQTIVTGFVVLPGIEFPEQSRLPLIMRPADEELRRCMRYFQNITSPEETAVYSPPLVFFKASTTIWDHLGNRLPVEMRVTPTFEHSSPSWVTSNINANEIAIFNTAISAFGTISGALTVGTSNLTSTGAAVRLTAGTSFGGANGDPGQLYVGENVYMRLSARL
ncbi:MAG: DUF2793 domain-containing protein [Xanthobacteraceae bacterium]